MKLTALVRKEFFFRLGTPQHHHFRRLNRKLLVGEVNRPKPAIALPPGTRLAPPPLLIKISGPISTNSRSYTKRKKITCESQNEQSLIYHTVVNSKQRSK